MKTSLPDTTAQRMTPSWDLVRPGLLLIRKHNVALIYLFALPALLYILGAILPGVTAAKPADPTTSRQIVGYILVGIALLWSIINVGPTLYLQTKAARGGKVRLISEYYRQGLPFTLRVIGASILYGLMVIIGLVLLIVPGVILFQKYFLVTYYIVDRKLSIREAFKAAGADAKLARGPIWGIIGVQVVILLAASFIEIIPVIGIIVGELITLLAFFLPALRYVEVAGTSE